MALNPWLEKKLAALPNTPPEGVTLNLLVECYPSALEMVKRELQAMPDVSVGRTAFRFIEATVPLPLIRRVAAMTGVFMVHYNMPKKIFRLPRPGQFTSIFDPLIGEIKLDEVICPRDRLTPALLLPLSLRFFQAKGPLGEVNIIPTSQSRMVIRDVESPLTGNGVTLAVLDTGWAPQVQILRARPFSTCSTDPTPFDGHGHGSWCTSAAGGVRGRGFFGECEGVAPGADLVHVKVLHGLFGFGNEMDIIKGMETARQMGARVISMSLGGDTCQGGCDNCPECLMVKELSREGVISVIAAGNSGPERWTIGCPGCSPAAITVGSVSIMDQPRPAWFSSRGPQNPENAGIMEITPDAMKPDVLAPGGGRAQEETKPDEVLYSGEYGVMAGMYSGVKEPLGYDGMHGTSQATPHVAGLVACLLEGGLISSAETFKHACAEKGQPKDAGSGWGVVKLSWFL